MLAKLETAALERRDPVARREKALAEYRAALTSGQLEVMEMAWRLSRYWRRQAACGPW